MQDVHTAARLANASVKDAESTNTVEETVETIRIETSIEAVNVEEKKETGFHSTEEVHEEEIIVCDEVSKNYEDESEPYINIVSYCKICRTCSDETQCEEDLWWHLMNNHYPRYERISICQLVSTLLIISDVAGHHELDAVRLHLFSKWGPATILKGSIGLKLKNAYKKDQSSPLCAVSRRVSLCMGSSP